MVIQEESDDGEQPVDSVAGAAYQTNMTSVDGMARDAKGNLKFNKNTKRGRATEEDNDVDMLADVMPREAPRKKVKTKQPIERLGTEFRAKVSVITCRRSLIAESLDLNTHRKPEVISNELARRILTVTCPCRKPPNVADLVPRCP